jgi:AraC-like DNA-binding protein
MRVARTSLTEIGGPGYVFDQPVIELPALTHCGEALCTRGHYVPPDRHTAFEFHYLSRGGYSWQIGRETVDHAMGDISVFYPNELHSTGPRADQEIYLFWIGLHLAQLGPEGKRLATLLRRKKCRILTRCHEVEPILRGLISQVTKHRPFRSETILTYLQTFIALIHQRALSGDSGSDSSQVPYSRSIRKAIDYLEEHPNRRIPLIELVAVAGKRHVSHFCAQFHQETGFSPSAYHRRLRLHAAREDLNHHGITITTVALRFGFSSSQHFSTCFREEFGVSPRHWQHDQ